MNIGSLNVNGLNAPTKQLALKIHCDAYSLEILVLVDTRLDDDSARILENNWDNRYWIHSLGINTGRGIGRGISIGILKSSPITVLDTNEVKQGNMFLMQFSKESKNFCLACVYGPSDADRPGFFERLFFEMAAVPCNHKFAVGDFNVALNHDKDTINYTDVRRPNARAKILDKIEEGGFVDIFRARYPQKLLYSWECISNDKKARLDFFLINSSLEKHVLEINYANLFASDHRLVFIKIDFANFTQGKGLWKYRPWHASDEILHHKIIREIYNSCMRYVKIQGFSNFYEEANFGLIANFRNIPLPDLLNLTYNLDYISLFETIINDIKVICAAHSISTTRGVYKKLDALKKKILEEETASVRSQVNNKALKDEYETLVNDLATQELLKKQGCFKVDGEKPSKFFLNLEKHVVSERYIPMLREGTSTITDQANIEIKIRDFYADLYSNKDDQLGLSNIAEYIEKYRCINA